MVGECNDVNRLLIDCVNDVEGKPPQQVTTHRSANQRPPLGRLLDLLEGGIDLATEELCRRFTSLGIPGARSLGLDERSRVKRNSPLSHRH